jgi:LemA protein
MQAAVAELAGAVIVIAGIFFFNRLVKLRNTVRAAWSDIDVQLKKRADLVPNLVEAVKGYSAHEKTVFEAVTSARSTALKALTPSSRSDAEAELGRSIGGLVALAEAYPQLMASQGYLALQGQLTQVEDDIEHARRYYNAVVRDFNTARESFPSNAVAGLFRFAQAEPFGLDAGRQEEKAVQVGF